MKNQKFNAVDFLNIKVLSPLESNQIKGGLSDEDDKVKQKQKQKVKEIKVVVTN